MGTGCFEDCRKLLDNEDSTQINIAGKVNKTNKKRVSFSEHKPNKDYQKKSSNGSFFGVFDSSDKELKGILKAPSPKSKFNNENNIINNQNNNHFTDITDSLKNENNNLTDKNISDIKNNNNNNQIESSGEFKEIKQRENGVVVKESENQ